MQLDYLWINDFRVLKNFAVNFSTQVQYSYDKDLRQLSIISTPNPLKDFFGNNITEVTAFIGKNGVGKSTLFDFINRNLANHLEGAAEIYEDGYFIAVFEKIIYTKSTDLIQNIDVLIKSGYKIFQDDNNAEMYYSNGPDNNIGFTDYGKLKYLYYSNVFDLNINYHDPLNLIDISTNNLLRVESYKEDKTEEIGLFYSSELKRQIDFISEVEYQIPFRLPEEIFIYIDEQAFKYKQRITYDVLEKEGLKKLADFIYNEFTRTDYKSFRSFLFKNLIEYRSYLNPGLYKGIEPSKIFSILWENKYDDKGFIEQQKEELSVILSFMNEFDHLVSSEIFKIVSNDKEEQEDKEQFIDYKIRKDNSAFSSFLYQYYSLVGLDSSIHFFWRNLSSGEKAFLTLFSRLNYANKRINSDNDHKIDFIILMIDELDLYFHPEWQRRYLFVLLELIPKIFSGKKVQLLLSTHSPFIASDLPSQNIRYLEKRPIEGDVDKEYCSISVKSDQDTFGANIYTLLADSFYMENGFVGEFAQSKINQLIDDLSLDVSKSLEMKNWGELLHRINIVGEPVIKKKLLEMYDYRRKEISIEEQIILKQEEIELLRKKLKK